jgi:hypothetical protein
MLSVLAVVGAYMVAGTLLWTGVGHVRRPQHLAGSLRRQRVLPVWASGPLSVVVALVELSLGAALVLLLLTPGTPQARRLALVTAAGLLVAYGLYGWFLAWQRPQAPCGCSPGDSDQPINSLIVVRAFVLSVAGAGAAGAADRLVSPAFDVRGIVTVLMAAALGVVLWNLPGALGDSPLAVVEQRRRDGSVRSWEGT